MPSLRTANNRRRNAQAKAVIYRRAVANLMRQIGALQRRAPLIMPDRRLGMAAFNDAVEQWLSFVNYLADGATASEALCIGPGAPREE